MWRLLALQVLTSALALDPPNSNIIELSGSNFNEMVLKSNDLWLVEFFTYWSVECKKLYPEFQKAADALKGVVKVGAVDIDKDEYLTERYNIKFLPTFKMFGENKKKPMDFDGPRTAQGFIDDALAMIPTTTKSKTKPQLFDSENVVRLTDNNFDNIVIDSPDMWLVVFYGPSCGQCKNLASHWVSAAFQLKGKMKFGALDATIHPEKTKEYVQTYPTVKYFRFGKKTRRSVVDYNGGPLSTDIVRWCLDKIEEDLPAPEILQILNDDSFKNGCQSKPFCVISVLPHILDCRSDCRNNYLDVLKRVCEKHKTRMWGWMWSQAGDQSDLEHALGMGGFGYPSVAVVNVKTTKYSLMKGSFSVNGINNFLWYLLRGRESFSPSRGFYNISSVEAWNGRDSESPNSSDFDIHDEL
uniref:Thioredoxin domain-containing protein n=1 Tax=Photinus pyralis TaxID=7054 RepID=A0A1Y1L2T2_PHOPY